MTVKARLTTFAANAVRIAALVWLALHFTLTALYCLPTNPSKHYFDPICNATIGTFFPQNWSLFAPDPISETIEMMVRPMTQCEYDSIKRSGMPTDNWHEVCLPFWRKFQANRLSSYDRLVRPATNSLNGLRGGIELAPFVDACNKGDNDACTFVAKTKTAERKAAEKELAKIASAFCNGIGGPPGYYKYVAVRERSTSAIPWTDRYKKPNPKITYTDVGLYRIDKSIVSTGLYQFEQ